MSADVGAMLRRFGVEVFSAEIIPAGRVNTSWAVDSRDAQYVLRRYNAARLTAYIPYEHAMLARLGYGDLPDIHIHGDFQRDNLLFDRGQLTGVLDFDNGHRDARVADIAWSIISDCAEPPTETAIDPRLAAAFVGGYAEHTPLASAELRLIVPMIRAHNLSILAWALRKWLDAPNATVLPRIERRVSVRLPLLDARAAAIGEAIAGALRRTD